MRQPLGVILTAGLGTRLRPLTPQTPKPLVPLLNRPLIAYALDLMASLGIREVVVVVGPEDTRTTEHVRGRASGDLAVSTAVQEEPRGPGDAVVSAGAALDDRTVVVLAVDTVLRGLEAGLLKGFEESEAVAGLVLKAVEDPRAFGVAVLEGERIVHLEEKPAEPRSNLALVGVWVLAPAAIERLRRDPYINAKGESDLTATVATMLDEGSEVRGWVLDGEWLDGGTLEGLLHAQSQLLPDLDAGAAAASGSRIEGSALIGEGARVDGCTLEATVVGAGAELRDVTLVRSLVAPGAHLEGGSYADVVVTPGGEVAGPGAPSAG